MERIRDIRRQLGWSQARFAEAMGVKQNTVSRWETGALTVNQRTLLAAEALLSAHADAA